jgi:hypothetical protein
MKRENLYFERPTLSSTIYIWMVAVPIGFLLLIWMPPSSLGIKVGVTIMLSVIFLIIGVASVVPFIRYREISLTSEGLYLRLGTFEDNISIYEMNSVEFMGTTKPETISGAAWGPWIHGFRTLFFPLGVVTAERIRWYVFGDKRKYFKIKRKSKDTICVGVANPDKFSEELQRLQASSGHRIFLNHI